MFLSETERKKKNYGGVWRHLAGEFCNDATSIFSEGKQEKKILRLFFFPDVDHFKKSSLNFLQYCFYFTFLGFFWPRGMGDLNSARRHQTQKPRSRRQSLNHLTTRGAVGNRFKISETQNLFFFPPPRNDRGIRAWNVDTSIFSD